MLFKNTPLVQKILLVRYHSKEKLVEMLNCLVGQGVFSNRQKPTIVSGNTIQAEGLSDFFNTLGTKGLNVSKQMSKKHFKEHNTSHGYYSKHCNSSSI